MGKHFVLVSILLWSCCCVGHPPARSATADLIDRLKDATVVLVEEDAVGLYYASCSGVWLSDTLFITAFHCVKSAGVHEDDLAILELLGTPHDPIGHDVQYMTWRSTLGSPDLPRVAETAQVIAANPLDDLALLRAYEATTHAVAPMAAEVPSVGDVGVVVGHSRSLLFSTSPGYIGGIREMDVDENDHKVRLLQVVSGASYGNSGGGVFGESGQLLGVCSFLLRDSSLSFFVRVEVVRELLTSADAASHSSR